VYNYLALGVILGVGIGALIAWQLMRSPPRIILGPT
jgi:hypothetical protein